MSRAAASITVVLGIATAAVLFVDWSRAEPVASPAVHEASAKVDPMVLATTAQVPRPLQRQPDTEPGEPAAEPEIRRPLQNLGEQLVSAETVAEYLALLARTEAPPDAAQRVLEIDRDLVRSLQQDREKLRAHRAAPASGDPAQVLTDKSLQVSLLRQEQRLSALRRGDYYFGGLSPHIPGRFFTWSQGMSGSPFAFLNIVMWDDDYPLLKQLNRELYYAKKIAEFNVMSEASRRRILKLREKSLREDPPEELGWLSSYFPEGFVIDASTSTIR